MISLASMRCCIAASGFFETSGSLAFHQMMETIDNRQALPSFDIEVRIHGESVRKNGERFFYCLNYWYKPMSRAVLNCRFMAV